jgi:hypothetical protein
MFYLTLRKRKFSPAGSAPRGAPPNKSGGALAHSKTRSSLPAYFRAWVLECGGAPPLSTAVGEKRIFRIGKSVQEKNVATVTIVV